jgi:SAM-dependent methyltransferase
MDEISKEYIISVFDRSLMMHGDRSDAVGWSSTGQVLRYQAMLDVGDIRSSNVLDFGCGKGDFYGFLKERGIPVDYSGIDINEKLIRFANQKYPAINFRVIDIEKESLDKDFDYIFLCGVFNLKVSGIDEILKNTLIRLFKHCKKALVFNALSSHDPHKDVQLHYSNPEDIFHFAVRNLSPHVSLRQDRIPYDFTLFVYREMNRFSNLP